MSEPEPEPKEPVVVPGPVVVLPPAASPASQPHADSALIRSHRHIDSVRPELRSKAWLVESIMRSKGHEVVAVSSVRTDEDQLKIWRVGREYKDGAWVVVGPVVTRAQTSADSPHGFRVKAALDWAFLLGGQLVGPKPGPNNDSWDAELPWAVFGAVVESQGLRWGGRFKPLDKVTGLGWDAGHSEMENWRTLPVLA